jgi:hypothetical protein
MRLLAMIADDRAPIEQILEMIKRLHISGYEQARPYFEEAIAEDIFQPNTAPGFYHADQIRAVLEWIAEQG